VNTYTVQRGDTLSGISRKFSVDVKALKKANKLRSDVLSPGQKLAIP
jgi:peptidoglycan endopeptidase LytE